MDLDESLTEFDKPLPGDTWRDGFGVEGSEIDRQQVS